MPNWVDNLLMLRGDSHSLDELATNVKTSDEEVFDFETIVPTPAIVKQSPHYNEVDHTHSLVNDKKANRAAWLCAVVGKGNDSHFLQQYIGYSKSLSTEKNDAILEAEFKRLVGANRRYWYSFNNKLWNTKWGACNATVKRVSDTELKYTFDTAWDTPKPVAAKLAEFFPELDIVHSFSEEADQIIGTDVYKGGKLVDSVETGSYYVDPKDDEPSVVQEL